MPDVARCPLPRRDHDATVTTPSAPTTDRFLTGLIGAPIAHSASPAMHERAAEALGVRCHYQLIEVAGAGRDELRALLDGVRRLGFAGVNVTFPYKEAVIELLDELSPGAAAIGAVNTVVVRDGRLIGHNTDTTGFAPGGRRPRHRLRAWPGRRDRRRRRRQGDRLCAGRPRRLRNPDLRHRSRQGRASRRAAEGPQAASGSPTASRTRCAAPSAWSTERRSACCRTAARRCRRRCCAAICGWPTRSIRRSGRRC